MSHILLVEDDRFMQEALSLTLEIMGCKVSLAADSDEAWRILTDHPVATFNAIISDMQMPGKDGLALLAEVKREESLHRNLPFILLSGSMTPELRERALQGGAKEALSKTEHKLQAILKGLLNLKE